jgi:hypothetical protein
MKKLLLVAMLAACSGDNDRPPLDAPPAIDGPAAIDAAPPDAADPALSCAGGVRPALEACVAGDLFADCGGTGAPVLGCTREQNFRCTWFTTGCAAAGYEPSPCPASDVCCIERWPFARGTFVHPLYFFFYAFGTLPWDRTREMNVVLNVDAELPDAPDGYHCEGIEPITAGSSPCGQRRLDADVPIVPQVRRQREGTIVVFTLSAGLDLSGWYPFIEIDTVAARARVCAYRYDDVGRFECPPFAALCASSGTLTLSALPSAAADWDSIHGHLDVQLGTLRLTADF